MRSTLKDVAKLAGVNFSLVSKYLNHNPDGRMSAETRARIDSAIQTLNYHPSAAARTLRSGRSRTLGMICGDLTNQYCAHAADFALKEAQKHGYQLLLAIHDPAHPEAALRTLTERNVDGIYFFAYPTFFQSETFPCPLVVNNFSLPGAGDVSIDLDDALTRLLSTLKKEAVFGVFSSGSYWREAFLQTSVRLRHPRAELFPLHHQLISEEELAALCAARPGAILANGWRTMHLLAACLKARHPDYRPKLFFHANCADAFIGDGNISGVISSSTTELIRASCALLIERIEHPQTAPAHQTIPAKFVPADDSEFVRFAAADFQLT